MSRGCSRSLAWVKLGLVSLLVAACRSSGPPLEPPKGSPEGAGRASPGDEIVVCGERFSTHGVPVVLWSQPPYYSAYRTGPRFSAEGPAGLRYQPGRRVTDPELARAVERDGWNLDRLRRQVDLFVLHYDVSGTSRDCFTTLQDRRELSVHFLLDVDGTVYQTLDLEDQAWHARQANPRSIGIEIAQIGAYPPGPESPLDRWYDPGPEGTRLVLADPSGVRPDPSHPGRPFQGWAARPERVRGTVQGEVLVQYDFTPEQYVSLVRLARTLLTIFPRIEPDQPRDAEGVPRTSVLSSQELDSFHGILGHLHVSASKVDPGPAFQWDVFLRAVRDHGPVDAAAFRGSAPVPEAL